MNDTNAETATIRKALRQLGFRGSVRHGSGTAYGWVEIRGSGKWGEFTDDEQRFLGRVGLTPGGNLCVIAPESRRYWVLKLTDPDNPLIVIEQHHARQAWQARMDG